MQRKLNFGHKPSWYGHANQPGLHPTACCPGGVLHGEFANRDFLLWLRVGIIRMLVPDEEGGPEMCV